jgi:hypothetical protein
MLRWGAMPLDPIRRQIVWTSFLLVLGFAVPAFAGAIYDKQWDPGLYGGLDQHSTHCADLACGPASAVNSFVFLQNMYPEIYGNSLAGDNYETWVDTANKLLDPHYMDCDCGNGGTTIDNFISGKENYLNDVVPGTTIVHFQNLFDVTNPIKPTWQFLYDELVRGQDIEILVGFYDETGRNGGHYVTVSGFYFSDTSGDGEIQADDETATLFYVDPDDGNAHNSTLGMKNGFLDLMGYSDKYDTYIEAAVAESPVPVPEPLTLSFFVAGLVGTAMLRGRKKAA